MFMDFWEAIFKRKRLFKDVVRKGKLYEIQLWKHLFHLRFNVLADAVVVVDMEETASQHVIAKVLCFHGIKYHVAMPCHIDVGIVEDIGAGRLNCRDIRIDICANFLIAETH